MPYTPYADKESLGSIRTKINDQFKELFLFVTSLTGIIGNTPVAVDKTGLWNITVSGDATLDVSAPPATLQTTTIKAVFFVSPGAHAVGFSTNIDWGDAGIPDLRANTVSTFTLMSFGGHTKWYGVKGNGGFAV